MTALGFAVRRLTLRRVLPSRGFYVMRYGGDRYTSAGWYLTREDASAEVARLIAVGHWRGMPPKVENA